MSTDRPGSDESSSATPAVTTDSEGSFVNNVFSLDEEGNERLSHRKASNANTLQLEESLGNGSMAASMLDFDDMLPLIGDFGKYQKILFLCMTPFAFFMTFVYFAQMFMTLIPDQHWCSVPELDELPLQERLALSIPKANGEYVNCRMYNVNYTELLANNVKTADPNWPRVECRHGWSYNYTEIPYSTVATEQNWVCQNAALPTYAQSIFFLGAIVGGLLFGWIADRFGRLPALIGCNLMGFGAGMATVLVTNFWPFALMRFFVGFAFDNSFTMIYILVLEYVGPKYRTFVANMSIGIYFSLAQLFLPWIAYYLADWKLLGLATSVPLVLVLLSPLFIPESARWLVSQGKVDRAIKILKKLENFNGKHIDADVYKKFHESCEKIREDEIKNSNYSILDLFRTPRLRRNTILLIAIWMVISLVFDGHIRNVGGLGLNVFLTFAVAGFTELPADILLTLTLDRWGRRWMASGSLVISGVFSLLASAVPIGIYSASLAIAGRFFINISYNIGMQYAAEILPTVVRGQGVAFIHILGYVATILAPFVVYLAKVSPTLPLIILGVLGVVGGLLPLLLPETLDQDLPQTLNDGEEFGRGQRFWDFPCLTKQSDERTQHFVRSTQTGAALSAATSGELRSSVLRRSVRSREGEKL